MATGKKYLCRWQMDNPSTFLELPLDRDLYKPQKITECEKPPLRILITEAGSKTARHLMYKICSGQVFGPNQPVILHLVNAKGCVSHKATLLDLEECGFPTLADSVVSAEPEKSYGNVDIVVLIALFEELSGHNMSNSFLCQLNKTRNVARNVTMYAKPNTKLIVCSPSTKGVIVLLTCIRVFEPDMNPQNITGVVSLDETIAKGLTAAQLRTTTDAIKNVIIWGGTIPDIHNATVFMYPPEDKGCIEKVEIPVMQVLENHKWIHFKLIPSVYKRILTGDLVKQGGAVASATARHLKLLFQGSDCQEEIISMAVIVPPSEPYGLTKNIGFSLPVKTSNGDVTVREDITCSALTHLMNMRSLYYLQNNSAIQETLKVIKYMKEFEETKEQEFLWSQHTYLIQPGNISTHYLRCIISPSHEESTSPEEKDVSSKKSITWEEANVVQKSTRNVKSVLRFNLKQNSL